MSSPPTKHLIASLPLPNPPSSNRPSHKTQLKGPRGVLETQQARGSIRVSTPSKRTITIALLSFLATTACISLFSTFGEKPVSSIPRVSVGFTSIESEAEYVYEYEVVPGFFAQSLNSTDDATFDYIEANFGVLDDQGEIDNSTNRWIKFAEKIARLNDHAKSTESFKVLFLTRHGEGVHNVAEEYYGTAAWDCFWAQEYGNGTVTWGPDALLTQHGINQALAANKVWKHQLEYNIPLPHLHLSSPLSRAASTLDITWSDIPRSPRSPSPVFTPVFTEHLRESIGLHTCDQRRSKTYLQEQYPNFIFEPGFTQRDELWGPRYQETRAQVARRVKGVLDRVWRADVGGKPGVVYVAVTAHGGTVEGILDGVGHRGFKLRTGGMIPVVVKGVRKGGKTTTTGLLTSTTAPACTADPSVIPTAVY